MTQAWDRIDASAIRDAIAASTDGRSSRYVYAKASTDGREFRIVGFKIHRGLSYGRELSTGKWVVIGQWQER